MDGWKLHSDPILPILHHVNELGLVRDHLLLPRNLRAASFILLLVVLLFLGGFFSCSDPLLLLSYHPSNKLHSYAT